MASNTPEEKFLLKNILDSNFVKSLAQELQNSSADFSKKSFIKQTLNAQWEQKELKQRISHIVKSVHSNLNMDYPQQVVVLKKAAPPFTGLSGILFPEFISTYGQSNWKISMQALKTLTEYSTSEFAIRFFIRNDPHKTLALMLKWSKDKNHHVRRLASEGCRPRLPWSFRLTDLVKDPSPILDILENLKNDESLYVRKSVANNLNDISKDHPELVLKLAQRWMKGASEHTQWIVKHALRTMLKQGNPKALKIFGVADAKNIEVKNLSVLKKSFKVGEHLSFSFELLNKTRAEKKLRIEYVIHYRKKNGELSPKVFKLAERPFLNGTHPLTRRHSLKPMTTRTHYPGLHKVSIVINGQPLAVATFTLTR